jgi:uncharacterized protein (TIGR02147 family)
MPSAPEPPEVFAYLDYRRFLRDYYRARKGRGFSYRAFARRAQLRSPNYLKLVIDGERNLSGDMASRFARACGLEHEEAAYFEDLVNFNQAKTSAARAASYDRLRAFRRYRSVHKLEVDQADYHATWYLPAIRELAARDDFKDDPAWIAQQLLPPIPTAEARRALDLLVRLGLLAQDEEGQLQRTDAHVSTGAETSGMHIATYHRMMMGRASEAIDVVGAAQRDISSLTLCLGPEGLTDLKRRIQMFRRELLQLSEDDPSPRQVVQLNMQLFPLSCADEIPSGDER